MAKTVKSFSLEGDMIDKIVDYKNKNGLSSDSAALERMLLAFKDNEATKSNEKLDNIEGLLVDLISRTKNNNNVLEEVKEIRNENINSQMDDALSDIMSGIEE